MDGVSVAKREHNLLEWLQGHWQKPKDTLMLASPDDIGDFTTYHLFVIVQGLGSFESTSMGTTPLTENDRNLAQYQIPVLLLVIGRSKKHVVVGNKRLMLALQIPVSPEAEEYISDTEQLARICVLIAMDGVNCGAFAISDPLKPEAGHIISFLNSIGISGIKFTGDNWATATTIAITIEMGISSVFAETDSMGKAENIKDLQMKGLTGMVGDGINDSPALVAANVGMAIDTWTMQCQCSKELKSYQGTHLQLNLDD